MAEISDLRVGTQVECTDGKRMNGARGTVQKNGGGLWKNQDGYFWVVWENPDNKVYLRPGWINCSFVKVI